MAVLTKHVWPSKFSLLPLTGRGITLYSFNTYTGVSFTSSLLLASEQLLRLQLSRFLIYPISRDFRVSPIIEYIRSVLKKIRNHYSHESRFKHWCPQPHSVVCHKHFRDADFISVTTHGKLIIIYTELFVFVYILY